MLEALVLLNGVPGSGKSFLGPALESGLGLPRLGKDGIKEPLWDAMPPPEGTDPLAWSRPGPVEVYLTASAEVLHRRYHDRHPTLHPCHRHHPLPDLEEVCGAADRAVPLGLGGPLLRVDSTNGIRVDDVIEWVRARLMRR